MFSASADLYDLIYSGFKDYRGEAAQIAAAIRTAHPGARQVLDVACGTGEHARLLMEAHGFDVDGLDVDAAFVRIAQEKISGGSVYEADVTSFELPGRYDVILCLFSSIAYVRTLENVRRTLEHFVRIWRRTGSCSWSRGFAPNLLEPGRIDVSTAEGDGVRVCRMSHMEVEGRLSRLRFDYLIGRPSGIEHAREVHDLGLFTPEELLACFREAGLTATVYPEGSFGRGLYLARAA